MGKKQNYNTVKQIIFSHFRDVALIRSIIMQLINQIYIQIEQKAFNWDCKLDNFMIKGTGPDFELRMTDLDYTCSIFPTNTFEEAISYLMTDMISDIPDPSDSDSESEECINPKTFIEIVANSAAKYPKFYRQAMENATKFFKDMFDDKRKYVFDDESKEYILK